VLRELVVNGAEGNPFYIEELVKTLIDQGVVVKGEERWSVQAERLAQANVPSTLTGVLQARLDSLAGEERAVLQQASVVGRVFWDRALEYFHHRLNGAGEDIGRKLDGLRAKEMVFRREESIIAQAHEYIFKHEILREVTYETVLKKLRSQYHGWVADWLVEQGAQCGEEYSGLIAEHLELAGKIAPAREYLRRAGQAALASYANSEAARYFRRALDLVPPETDRPALLGELAEALLRQGYRDEAFSAWREGISLYQDQGNLESVLRYYTAIIRTLLPDWPIEAVSECEIALTFVEGLPETPTLGHFFHQVARAYYFYGNRDKAFPLCHQALEIAKHTGDFELQADVLVTTSVLHFSQPEKALEILQQSVQLAESNRFFYVAWRAHHNLAIVYSYLLSDHRSAITHFYRSWEIARQYGAIDEEAAGLDKLIIESISIGDINAAENYLRELERVGQKMPQPELIADRIFDSRAQVAIVRGQLEEAYELLTKSLNGDRREGRAQNIHSNVIYSYLPVLLDMHRYLGWTGWELAEQTLEEVIALVAHTGGIVGAGEAEALFSVVFARQGRTEEARRWLKTARAQIPPDPLDFLRYILYFAEAELAIAEGSWEEAIEKTEALLQGYTMIGLHWKEAHTLLELAEIYRLRGGPGDKEKALDLYGQAEEIFAEIGATGYVEIVKNRLL
jgi:tetratricopeptide (TPR) repeat protein